MAKAHKTPNRIDVMFDRLKAEGRKALVTFAVADDPDREESLAALHAFVASGIDLIELGYPFSDPILDGATIQRANRRALEGGGNLAAALDLVAAFRQTDTTTPIILMGYSNPLVAMGYEAFASRAAAAGVDGIIAADMPLREADDLLAQLDKNGLVMVALSAPTLDAADFSARPGVGGFLYCIPVVGSTGGPSASIETISGAVERLRPLTKLPVLVGFGIKTPQAAAQTAAVADGAIVASALIEEVHSKNPDRTSRLAAYARLIGDYRQALDAL